MSDLSYAQLEGAWINAGGDKAMAPLMAAIAMAESGGNPNATNPNDNGGRQTSWGLWQISLGNHNEPAANWNDPVENAKLALGKLSSQGLGAWGTYTSGAYKRYLQSNVSADTSGTATSTGASSISSGTSVQWWNPLSWLTGIVGDTATVMANVLGPVAALAMQLNSALNSTMHAVLWLINPANWVRIFAGIAGTVALIAGLIFVARAA